MSVLSKSQTISTQSWVFTALSGTLAGILGPFGLAYAMGLERVTTPISGGTGFAETIGIRLREIDDKISCLEKTMDLGTNPCPQPCMIQVSLTSMTTVSSCGLTNSANWQCKWPTQWMTERLSCNEIITNLTGALSLGSTGFGTIEREYEIQQCGQVVVPTGKEFKLVDVSECNTTHLETRTVACPDRANANLADDIGGPVGALWRQVTSHETGWTGAGVTLTRAVQSAANKAGKLEPKSRGDWVIHSVACQRNTERQVFVPCDGTTVELCEEPVTPPDTTTVTSTTVMSGTQVITITRTIVVKGEPLPPVCNTVPAGNTFNGCITDFRPGSITVNTSLPAELTGYNQYGLPILRRPWSYSSTKSIYSSTCRGPISGNFNSGKTITTMGLNNDLVTTHVIQSEAPVLLQQNCSQAGMTTGWTTHEYGGDGGNSSDSAGSADSSDGGCSCGDGSTGGNGDSSCGDSV